jgi:hypothetical protein
MTASELRDKITSATSNLLHKTAELGRDAAERIGETASSVLGKTVEKSRELKDNLKNVSEKFFHSGFEKKKNSGSFRISHESPNGSDGCVALYCLRTNDFTSHFMTPVSRPA